MAFVPALGTDTVAPSTGHRLATVPTPAVTEPAPFTFPPCPYGFTPASEDDDEGTAFHREAAGLADLILRTLADGEGVAAIIKDVHRVLALRWNVNGYDTTHNAWGDLGGRLTEAGYADLGDRCAYLCNSGLR